MYKLTFTIILAIGIMAFNKPNSGESADFENISTSINHGSTTEYLKVEKITFYDQKEKGNKKEQGNKGKKSNHSNKSKNQHFDKKGKEHHSVRQVSKKHSKQNQGNSQKKHYKKGHPNYNYVFVNTPGYYSHKNYGQWRSEQAKMKHKKYKPKYEYQAIEGFNLLTTRNVFLFQETDYKINLLNTRLAKKRKANQIDVVQYEQYTNRIEVLQERRAALNINISL